MAELTRRSFLTHASIGVAGGALAGGLTSLPGLSDMSLLPAPIPAAAATEPVQGLIAHVRNVSTGEISIMVGTREVIHQDRSLALRLVDAASKASVR
jgi:hypothetical protein